MNADSLLSEGNFNLYLNNQDIWYATFTDLVNWNLKKEQIEVKINSLNDEYEIKIRNNGSAEIKNIGIWLSIPDRNLHIKNKDNSVKLTFDNNKKMYFLNINQIEDYKDLLYIFYKINE